MIEESWRSPVCNERRLRVYRNVLCYCFHAMIKEITVRGYRSIRDLSLQLQPINVLTGPNGWVNQTFTTRWS
jgi:hypothetical protein